MLTPDAVAGLSRAEVFYRLCMLKDLPHEEGRSEETWKEYHGPDPLGWLEAWRKEKPVERGWEVRALYEDGIRIIEVGLVCDGSRHRSEECNATLACARALLAAKLAQAQEKTT